MMILEIGIIDSKGYPKKLMLCNYRNGWKIDFYKMVEIHKPLHITSIFTAKVQENKYFLPFETFGFGRHEVLINLGLTNEICFNIVFVANKLALNSAKKILKHYNANQL